jgi:hypothetical protein
MIERFFRSRKEECVWQRTFVSFPEARRARVRAVGALAGGEAIRWGVQANTNPPVLRTHDRYGNRVDEVEFHPAWHELMRAGITQDCTRSPGASRGRAPIRRGRRCSTCSRRPRRDSAARRR